MLGRHNLILGDFNVRDMGIEKLFDADWTLLRKIDLSTIIFYYLASNQLTDASLILFAKHKWDNLVSLHLGKNEFTD